MTTRSKMKLRVATEIFREDLPAPDAEVSTEEIVDVRAARDGRAGIANGAALATLELGKG